MPELMTDAKLKDEILAGAQQFAPLSSFAALPVSAPTPFHTREYLMAYRRAFGARKKFHRLRAGENNLAFLMTRGRSARRLEWWGAGIHDIGGAIYDSTEGASTLWRKIEALASHHDGAHLAQIAANDELVELARSSGWTIQDAEKCPVLELPPTWEEYLKLLGKNMREQIKRYPKRLEKEFEVEYSLAQSEDEVRVALDDLFRLHGARWRARGQTGVLATPRRQKFHRAVCQSFLKRDWLRLWTLRCNGQSVCVLLNYFYGGRYYFFIGGFAPEYARWSVGTCLFSKVFQRAIEDGATEFDFLKGEEEYKYRFGATNRDFKTLSFFQSTPRGKLLQRRILLEEKLMQKLHEKFSAAHR
jgi:CelD/BcsL family acetyltransferase involved in cellulose biosynthesis